MTMLALLIRGRIFMDRVNAASMTAAVIFGLAHVRFSFAPFAASYQLPQVLYSIALG